MNENGPPQESAAPGRLESGRIDYRELEAGGLTFRVPVSGYLFNNADCWAKVEGSRARVGISDFLQRSAVRVLSFEPPRAGLRYSIFDKICSLPTERLTLDVISPVSGELISINPDVVESPDLMHQDPYGRGWLVELELSDLDYDIEFLMDCEGYLELARAKLTSGGPRRSCPCTPRGAVYRRPDADPSR
ncbi:MAG: hypothetical protein KKF41_10950 [Actinobacteria bacterium]|nr:hypothetical protein [Actinomycetota bacterium]MBU1944887.1 hypothetical protein [Actinomycetota bacterium]MBU2688091.1 hypothetical protein [Actinomycetota bacterium]